jgi:hypothetical protein
MATPAKTTIAVSITEQLADDVRAEAIAQHRPISWVVEDLLRSGLAALRGDEKPAKGRGGKVARAGKQHQKVVGADRHGEAHAADRSEGAQT